jgi:tetratricopeptide (TPR) repeat protein
MTSVRTTLACIVFAFASLTTQCYAQGTNLLPKYGGFPRTDVQLASDEEFFRTIDKVYGGDRSKAAQDFAFQGWNYLGQGTRDTAMRRFNQAWLLDKSNGTALWGMAAILGGRGDTAESLKLFAEAERTLGSNINFSADYAMTLGVAGADSHNEDFLKDAFSRFERNYQRAPQHAPNLQNWAKTLFHVKKYAEAWEKVKLAEDAPGRAELDANFIAALQAEMPRP